ALIVCEKPGLRSWVLGLSGLSEPRCQSGECNLTTLSWKPTKTQDQRPKTQPSNAGLPQVAVADLGHGDDHGGIGAHRLLQLAAEAGDVRVDGAAVEVQVDAVVPHAGEQLVAGDDALLVLEEVHQEVELLRRELE